MKIGIKIYYPNELPYIQRFLHMIDFVEIMAVEGKNYKKFRDIELPIVIHNEHSHWGVNFANPFASEKNMSSLRWSQELADMFDAKYIIVHPGKFENKVCAEHFMTDTLKEITDKRILIENVPHHDKRLNHFGYDYRSMKRILKLTGKKMNFDFPHAAEAAAQLGKRPGPFVKRLLSLRPAHFHMSDTRLNTLRDMHLHLEEGTLPLPEYKKLLPKNAWVTLETSNDYNKTRHDIEFLRG